MQLRAEPHAIVRRARALLGARYRPQGRSAEDAIDCVGVALCALGLDGEGLPRNYSRRSFDPGALFEILHRAGLRPVPGDPTAGDLLTFSPGPCHLHFAIHVGRGFVHADARLGRVVERPFPAPWPLLAAHRPDEARR